MPTCLASAGMKARLCFLLLVSPAVFLAPAAPASADSPSAGGDVTVAQTLGDRDLTLILRRVTSVPGPLRVDVITHAGSAAGTLGVALGRDSRGQVRLGAKPGAYGVTLRVGHPGPWQLTVSDGVRTARVPFVVSRPAVSPPERAVYGGFLVAGALLLVGLGVAVRARRPLWALLPGAGVVAGLAVAITGAVLSASLPPPPEPGLRADPTIRNATDAYAVPRPFPADWSRPPVTLTVGLAERGDVALYLTDAATGLPVDDLVVHDGALIHLMVVGPGGQLWHLHPIRTAPGVFSVRLAFPRAGHYAVAAELERRGGGVQMVRSATGLDVAAGATVAAALPAPPVRVSTARKATTTVSGVTVSVAAIGMTTASATTLTATVGDTATLQPWLGMLGHLIIVGPVPSGDAGPRPPGHDGPPADDDDRAPVWAHAHSMGDLTPMAGMAGMAGRGDDRMPEMAGLMPANGDSAADETVAAYGPSLSFTFTFAQPGRYRIWIQAERDYRVLTIPAVLDVTAGR
jgi:hypothetical protein